MSRGTKCRKFLFILSANPPPDKALSTDDFLSAIDRSEIDLGLVGQPRAIVFHEKDGRRHAHCVWSRIDSQAAKAVHIPFTKKKLFALTREIFMERGWDMSDGLKDRRNRDPRNFTLAEWQQAKRNGKDPCAIKTALRDAWASSDSQISLIHALAEKGYVLAQGRRGRIVVVDHHLEVYALARSLREKTNDIRMCVTKPDALPRFEAAKANIAKRMSQIVDQWKSELRTHGKAALGRFERKRAELVKQQRAARKALKAMHAKRQIAEVKERHSRFRKSVGGL